LDSKALHPKGDRRATAWIVSAGRLSKKDQGSTRAARRRDGVDW